MAANQLRIDGLPELRAALKALPSDLKREAAVIVHAQAEAARSLMAAAYPVKTGNLRRGLTVELGSDPVSATARVKNRARHAYLYEMGTSARQRAGGGRTGTMPAAHVFVPIAMARRRLMVTALIQLIERAGLTVTGTAA